MDLHDVASRSLVTRGRAACRSFPEPSVAAWRDEPAVRGCGRDPADRPDPETIPILVDARGHQGRVGAGLAAKKADAVVRMSFAPRSSATSLRRRLSSSSVACASCADCAAAAPSAWSRQRRSETHAHARDDTNDERHRRPGRASGAVSREPRPGSWRPVPGLVSRMNASPVTPPAARRPSPGTPVYNARPCP